MFRRHLAHVSAATALILAATACAATPSPSGSIESADQDADATAPPTDPQQGSEVDMSGIAELTDTSPSNPQERLVVSDPATGEQRAEILIPDHADPIPGRTMLSADFRHAVFEDDSGEIGVYRLDDDASPPAYVEDYRITPPESSYSGGSVTYSRAQFSPDGETLWFEASTDKSTENTLMSVPYANYEPGEEPRESGLLVDALRDFGWTFDAAGAPVVTESDHLVTVGDPATELSARGWTNESGGFVLDSLTRPDPDGLADGVTDLSYIPRAMLGPGEFVVVRAYGETDPQTAEQYGAVARAEIDVEAGTVTLAKLLPVGAEPIVGSIVAPDGSQAVLVPDGESPYLADLTTGGEPQPVDLPIGLGQTVGWL